MRPVYLFDDGLGDLAPMTALRAAFEVRIGPVTLLELFQTHGLAPDGFMLWGLFVPKEIATLCRERSGLSVNELRSGGDQVPVLVLNGRCAIPDWPRLRSLAQGHGLIEAASGDLIAACIPEPDVPRVLAGARDTLKTTPVQGRSLLSKPWHARSFRDAALSQGLERLCGRQFKQLGLATPGVSVIGRHQAWVADSAKFGPGVVLDTEGGQVAIAAGAVIRPGAIIVGPAYVGPNSTVLDRAVIRPNTIIGPHCKVAGEVAGTTFQGYSNKAHDGFLGDSWIGEWVNLGAGTTNSNLLNTYAEVIARATPDGPNERTGEQFLGAIIGDHVKTAICTRIMTGAVIHTGSMLAATAAATGCIPPFSWITDAGVRRYRLDKFVEVATAAMARRGVVPSKAYLDRLAALHAEDAN